MNEEIKELEQIITSLQSSIAVQNSELTTLNKIVSGLMVEIEVLRREINYIKERK